MQTLANWHALKWEECLQLLGTGISGLTEGEASRRLGEIGPNQLEHAQGLSPLGIFIGQFKDFMIIVLLAATLVSGMLGEFADSLVIIAIVLVNAILGFVQEYRAEKAINALKELTAPQVDVIRNGQEHTLDVRDLVPGDMVLLQAGLRIPADLRIVQAVAMEVEEAALTGESLPVRKGNAPVGEGAMLSDRTSMLYAGTLITRGHGQGVVVATGMSTEVGRIAEMLQTAEREPTPLQTRLEQLGRYIVWACLLICVAVVALGVARGEQPATMFLAGVSLAVAAIPEGLPAIVTIALAIGVQRMIKVNAIVRKLPAVETLGCSTVICSDKTGTLTKNEMTVREIWLPRAMYSVTGDGYAPAGEIRSEQAAVNVSGKPDLEMLINIGVICNNSAVQVITEQARLVRRTTHYQAKGDPTEAALITLGAKVGLTKEKLADSYAIIDELPFDSERKRMSMLVKGPQGDLYSFCKGAPDVLLDLCTHYMDGSKVKRLSPDARNLILKQVEQMADRALRVLAAAYKPIPDSGMKAGDYETNLVFVGLYGMIDPPRPEVRAALLTCRQAGINTVMITGDHARTAQAIGLELGLISKVEQVVTGEQLNHFSERELDSAVRSCRIFARVSPHHKLQIVRSLKQSGHVVAMTGDGINDAPALMESDIGVAMGRTGTDVAKEASALILSDDNFSTIVSAVREGRGIYDNIRKFIRYLLACNVGELMTVFLSMLMSLPLPLKPLQILWVNLVTDGLPAMALGVDGADRDLMKRAPRQKSEGVFARGLARKILTRGILIGITTTGVFALAMSMTANLSLSRTMAFATLVFCQLFHVFDCRSETMGILEKGLFSNPFLVVAVFISCLMFLAVLYVPGLRQLFDTVALDFDQWLIVLGCAGAPTFFIGLRRILLRRLR